MSEAVKPEESFKAPDQNLEKRFFLLAEIERCTEELRRCLMMPETQEAQEEAQEEKQGKFPVQRSVFDLKMFNTIILKKYVDEPPKPKDLADAMQMVGNNIGKLPNLIWKGLKDEARDAAYANMEGFRIEDEDKDYEEWEIYTGKFADENKSKLINAAVLTVAKLQGYNKSMSPDEKRKAKETAREFLRSNPAMLKGIQD